MLRTLLVTVCLFHLSACSVLGEKGQTGPFFDEIIVLNNTLDLAKNVEIRVEKFNRKFYCGAILAKSECANGFHKRPFQNNVISLHWQMNGMDFHSDPFIVGAPSSANPDELFTVLFVLKPDGEYTMRFNSRQAAALN